MASTQPLRTQPLSTHAVPTPASGTVGLLVQLKLRLLRNGLTRSVWKIVGLVVGGLYGLFVVAMAWIGFGALRFAAPEYIGPVTVVVFSLISIGWVIFSTLVFGIDDTLNPARFALLPLSAQFQGEAAAMVAARSTPLRCSSSSAAPASAAATSAASGGDNPGPAGRGRLTSGWSRRPRSRHGP